MDDINFENAKLKNVVFNNFGLSGVNFSNAVLDGVKINNSDYYGAKLSNSVLKKETFLIKHNIIAQYLTIVQWIMSILLKEA